MAATTEQKVDFLLKKIGYVASKTGIAEDENSLSGTKKAPFAEAIPSPLVTPSTSIWADASLIPATPPGSDTSYVRVYLTGTSGVRMTVDNTVSGNRTFIARSTYGNDSSAILGDWIDTSFGADYIIKVFKGDPNSGGVQLSAAGAGSNDTWFFDYSSGVLNFNGTQIPSGVTSSNIYIVGYRYIGAKGGRPAAGIATFSSLDVAGISTFRDDVNFIGQNYNVAWNKTGSSFNFSDNSKVVFGTGSDMSISHNGTNSIIKNITGDLNIQGDVVRIKKSDGSKTMAAFIQGGQAEFYYDTTKRFETTPTGAQVIGNLNVTGVLTYDDVTNIDSLGIITARTGVDVNAGGINVDGGGLNIVGVSTFANDIIANGSIDLAGDIDVDGHTELDNVNISGVTTFAGNIDANGDLDVDGHTNLDNVSIAGVTTMSGDLTVTSGDVIIQGVEAKLHLTDTNNDDDYLVFNNNGTFKIYSATDNADRLSIAPNGNVSVNHDLDVDGHTELDNVNISGLTTAALLNVSSLTDGRVTFASASGRLVDSANLTFDGTNLIAASAKITDLTSGRVVTAGTNGALQDSANLTFNGSLLDVTGNLAVSGNVSIAGTLTYQDVTNVDSVGIATARVGIKVLAGGIEIDGGGIDVQAGVSTFASNIIANGNIDLAGDIDVDGHTDLDNVNIAGVTTFASNIIANGNIDLAGDIDVDGHTNLDNVSIAGVTTFADDVKLKFGNGGDLEIFHRSADNNSIIKESGSGVLSLETNGANISFYDTANNVAMAKFFTGGSCYFNFGATTRLETTNTGINVIGNVVSDGLVVDGNSDLNGDLDVDGHTNLDNVSVAGVTTFSDNVTIIDGKNLYAGTDNDLSFRHTGGDGIIKNTTGQLYLVNQSSNIVLQTNNTIFKNAANNEDIAKFNADGSVDLYYNNTVRLQTSGIGVTVTGETKTTTLNVTGITTTNNLNVTGTATIASIGSTVGVSSNFYFGDGKRLYFGQDEDLSVYHDGSNSYINETGTGSLIIRGADVEIQTVAGNKYFTGASNVAKLYHANNEKLATTSTGINVTGTIDTDNFVNAGVSTFVGIITASAVGNVIPFLFNNYSDLPAASSYHGAFAHVHTVAKGFFAHAGNWVEIVSKEADGRVGSGTETYNIKDLNISGITTIADDKKLYFGNDQDLELYYQTSGVAGAYLQTGNASGNLTIRNQDAGQYVYIHGDNVHLRSTTNNEAFLQAQRNGAVKLYYDNAEKIQTKVYGVEVTGTADMDGLVVSGVSTFAGGSFSGNISAVDGTFSGNVSIAGTLTYQDVTNIDSVGIVTARTDLHVGTGATVIKTVNGQVGINSTIPAHMLDVGGVINSSTDVRVNNESLVTQNQALNDAVAMAIALG